MAYYRTSLKLLLKKNFEPTIATSNIENKPWKWKQRKTTVGTLTILIPSKIYTVFYIKTIFLPIGQFF